MGIRNKLLCLLIACGVACTAWAAEVPKPDSFTNSIGMKFVRIEPGNFIMGADSTPLPDEIVSLQHGESDWRTGALRPAADWTGARQGLVGVIFGQPDLSDPERLEQIGQVNGSWTGDNKIHQPRSARWRGLIKAPATGVVTFSAEASNSRLRLKVENQLVVDGWEKDGVLTGQVQMIKGRMVPVLLEYVVNKGAAYLRLYWSWPGQNKVLVPAEALWHRAEDYNLAIVDLCWDPKPKGPVLPRLRQGDYDETPRHEVTITKPFHMSQTEVTIEQFKKFRPDYPGFKARLDHHPYVSGISWYDAVAFCEWLSDKEGIPYRLPTEAEWEYACRAGTQTPFSSGNGRPPHETANPWALKNMHTGVLEWCLDWHGLYPETPQTDPVGPAFGWVKVVRGGGLDTLDKQTMSFYFGREVDPWAVGRSPFYARCANRAAVAPSFGPPPREYQAKQMANINPALPRGPQSPSPYRAKGMVGGHHHIGIRVVQAPMPKTEPDEFDAPFFQRCVKKGGKWVLQGPDTRKPYYRTRRIFPSLTKEQMIQVGWKIGLPPGLGTNQHTGALVALANGDLLAIYYNGYAESDPDLSILVVRLRYGSNHWDIPSVWPDFLDGNDASPFVWNDGGTIWLGWGCAHLTGGYPFQWTISKDNGATWGQIQFPIFESQPGGYGRRQPINCAFRGPDGTIYIGFDGWGATSGLWASRNDGRTWFDTGGRTLGLHSTFVLLDDHSILAYGTRNRTIDGFAPRNVSTDWGKTWQVSRSPVPGQGGGRNPLMMRLASGHLFYVSDFHQARDPNVKGFTRSGSYAGLSEDNGQTWRIRRLIGGQTRDENGKPVEVRTVGYVGAAQSPNGVINLVTSRNNPNLHIELNEAWVLGGDDVGAVQTLKDAIKVVPGPFQKYEEKYPSGRLKVTWSAGVGEDGRYLLHGTETWYYENGQKQWEVTYESGRKVGTETYWASDGSRKWRWNYQEDGTKVWTVWGCDGRLKARSHWREDKLLSHKLGNPGEIAD